MKKTVLLAVMIMAMGLVFVLGASAEPIVVEKVKMIGTISEINKRDNFFTIKFTDDNTALVQVTQDTGFTLEHNKGKVGEYDKLAAFNDLRINDFVRVVSVWDTVSNKFFIADQVEIFR